MPTSIESTSAESPSASSGLAGAVKAVNGLSDPLSIPSGRKSMAVLANLVSGSRFITWHLINLMLLDVFLYTLGCGIDLLHLDFCALNTYKAKDYQDGSLLAMLAEGSPAMGCVCLCVCTCVRETDRGDTLPQKSYLYFELFLFSFVCSANTGLSLHCEVQDVLQDIFSIK